MGIFGQRYVPAPGYERRYGAKDVNEFDGKAPRLTKYGKGKDVIKPTQAPIAKDTPTFDFTELEKILMAEDPQAAIEEQLIIHGEDGEDRLFCDILAVGVVLGCALFGVGLKAAKP